MKTRLSGRSICLRYLGTVSASLYGKWAARFITTLARDARTDGGLIDLHTKELLVTPYTCIILGPHREPMAIKPFSARSEREAAYEARSLARGVANAFGFEIWNDGSVVAHAFGKAGLRG